MENTYVVTPKGHRCLVTIDYQGTGRCETGHLYYGNMEVARWSYYDQPKTSFGVETLEQADAYIDLHRITIAE